MTATTERRQQAADDRQWQAETLLDPNWRNHGRSAHVDYPISVPGPTPSVRRIVTDEPQPEDPDEPFRTHALVRTYREPSEWLDGRLQRVRHDYVYCRSCYIEGEESLGSIACSKVHYEGTKQ